MKEMLNMKDVNFCRREDKKKVFLVSVERRICQKSTTSLPSIDSRERELIIN
jgi:hypothetical protein